MKVNKRTVGLIVSVVGIIVVLILAQNFLGEAISEVVTITTAVLGGFAILYQLKKDYQISKAEFIYSLNNTFSGNAEIAYIYSKLKMFRDNKILELSDEDGRRMGDYVMFFEIMGYLLDENMITLDMMDRIFANKFFLFMNNPFVHEYQLKYSKINKPLLELYCKWYNYRVKMGRDELYPKHSFTEYNDYVIKKPNREITLNKDKMNIGYE